MDDDRLVSLNAAIDSLDGLTDIFLNNLPPTIYKEDAIKALKAQPSATDTNVGGNLIDRQAAIEIVDRYDKSHMILKGKPMLGAASIVIELEALPSAQPKRKTGHWINSYKRQTCSICKQRGYRSWNFCPNCGADMRGEQDDESRSKSNAQTDTRARGMGTTDKSSGI